MTTEAYQAYKKLPSLLNKAYNPPSFDINLVKIKSRFEANKAKSSNRISICHEYDFPCCTQVSLCADDIESKERSPVMLYIPGCDIVSHEVLFDALRLQPVQDNWWRRQISRLLLFLGLTNTQLQHHRDILCVVQGVYKKLFKSYDFCIVRSVLQITSNYDTNSKFDMALQNHV